MLAPATQIREVLADLAKYTDPNNTPLGEDEENRLAWIGVELQGMDRELARANNVSDLTSDGQMGALVTYVYPDSPAAKAGVEAGFILLRLHVPGQPKPLEIKLMDTRFGGMDGFPWDKLDEVPAEYLDQIPTPWSSAENSFTRALTDIGVGQKYTAEFFHNGEVVKKDFVVVLGPRHYGSAPRYKSRSLGLTVRDLTYEVRRYFRTEAGDLGVIVSKIEPGGKAAIAGIMPYEIITHVDGTPVMNVKDLEKAIGKEGELRLSVKRRTLGRQVKINMTAGAEQGGPETRPASGMRGRLRDRLSGAMKRATTQKRPASTQPANAEEGEE